MNTKTIIATFTLVFTSSFVFSNGRIYEGGEPKTYPKIHGVYAKRQCENPTATYNPTSTALSVRFLANSQGGKVEIYRNGVKVVNTSAPAGASLSYVLRNYGAGDYTIVVSQGNTVVYSRTMKIK